MDPFSAGFICGILGTVLAEVVIVCFLIMNDDR